MPHAGTRRSPLPASPGQGPCRRLWKRPAFGTVGPGDTGCRDQGQRSSSTAIPSAVAEALRTPIPQAQNDPWAPPGICPALAGPLALQHPFHK